AARGAGRDDLGIRSDDRRLGAPGRGRRVRGSASQAIPERDRPAARDDAQRSRTRMSENPYARPSDPAKRRSAAITDGPERAGARSMLKAVGFTDDDLARPLVGVATTWIETMPCNLNQRELAQHVKRGVRDAGGTPL